MRPEKLKCIKRILLRKLNEIQFKMGRSGFEGAVINDNPSDVMDKASREFDQYMEMMMRGRESFLIKELQEALMRIDRGVFGICEVCKGRISERRLRAIPTSRVCVGCLEKMGDTQAA